MELSWLSHEDFRERVKEIWNQPVRGQNSVQRWNRKMGALRKHLQGWACHHHGVYKAQKECLQSVVTNLETQAELRNLTNGERDQLESARDDLIKLLREEELRFISRPKRLMFFWEIIIPGTFRWLPMENPERNVSSPSNMKAAILKGSKTSKVI